MFSTIDTTSARFLRAYLVVNGTDFAVMIPEDHKRAATMSQAIPTQANLEGLVNALATEAWVAQDYGTIAYREEKADALDGLAEWRMRVLQGGESNGQGPGPRRSAPRMAFPRFRATRQEEPAPMAEDIVSAESIRIEVWKYGFEQNPARLTAQKILEKRKQFNRSPSEK